MPLTGNALTIKDLQDELAVLEEELVAIEMAYKNARAIVEATVADEKNVVRATYEPQIAVKTAPIEAKKAKILQLQVQLKSLEDALTPIVDQLTSELSVIDEQIADDKYAVRQEYLPLLSAKDEEIRLKRIEIGEVK